MRDLPRAGQQPDDGYYPGAESEAGYPAEPPSAWGRPAEIAHEPSGGDAGAGERVPGPHDRDGFGPAGWSAGPRRPRRRTRGRPRWLVVATATVLAAAAGLGIGLATLGGGTARVALSSAGADTTPSPAIGAAGTSAAGVSLSPVTGTAAPGGTAARGSASAPASTSVSAPGTPSATASGDLGMQVGSGQSGPVALAGVLAAANNSVEGRGLLPPGKCGQYQQNAGGAIVCTAPVPGVAQVYYQNYSSVAALYAAYKTQVKQLDGGTFQENTRTCGNSAVSYAEFGWNQEEGHPHNFTVAQMAAGQVGPVFAAGRMACFSVRTAHGVTQDIVWTIDNGPAMGVAIGDGSPRSVYQLWASLHHAVLFRGTEMCGTADRMNFHDIPTGNLKVIPVCPAGVEALPATNPG